MSLITVIVPVYNDEKHIHRCIESILNQTFNDFELLIVDDGSTDKSGSICAEYALLDSRTRVFHQTNKGQAAARNFAIDWMFANSKSKYVSFVDSDDWIHPRYLELLLDGLIKYNVRISQCLHLCVDKDISDYNEVSYNNSLISVEEEYIQWYSGTIWAKLFKKECLSSIRFPEGQIYEDVATWYRVLFAENEVALIKDTLYYYYANPESTVRREWTKPRFFRIYAWDDIIAFLDKYGNKNILRNAIGRYCRVAKGHFIEIENSSAVSQTTKMVYKRKIKTRIRRILRTYAWALKETGTYDEYYTWTHPNLDWLYWTSTGIINKVKKVFKQK